MFIQQIDLSNIIYLLYLEHFFNNSVNIDSKNKYLFPISKVWLEMIFIISGCVCYFFFLWEHDNRHVSLLACHRGHRTLPLCDKRWILNSVSHAVENLFVVFISISWIVNRLKAIRFALTLSSLGHWIQVGPI